jgi:hypothetical protein
MINQKWFRQKSKMRPHRYPADLLNSASCKDRREASERDYDFSAQAQLAAG